MTALIPYTTRPPKHMRPPRQAKNTRVTPPPRPAQRAPPRRLSARLAAGQVAARVDGGRGLAPADDAAAAAAGAVVGGGGGAAGGGASRASPARGTARQQALAGAEHARHCARGEQRAADDREPDRCGRRSLRPRLGPRHDVRQGRGGDVVGAPARRAQDDDAPVGRAQGAGQRRRRPRRHPVRHAHDREPHARLDAALGVRHAHGPHAKHGVERAAAGRPLVGADDDRAARQRHRACLQHPQHAHARPGAVVQAPVSLAHARARGGRAGGVAHPRRAAG